MTSMRSRSRPSSVDGHHTTGHTGDTRHDPAMNCHRRVRLSRPSVRNTYRKWLQHRVVLAVQPPTNQYVGCNCVEWGDQF